jgi:hypothetical protein
LYTSPGRSSFFNYSFILHKLCLLEGLTNYIKVYGHNISSLDKNSGQNKIWEKICNHWNWL